MRRPTYRQVLASVALVGLFGMATVLVLDRRDRPPLRSDAARLTDAALVERLQSGGGVVDGGPGDPPVGGGTGTPARACVYTVEAIPSDQNVVGALASGYVAIWYRPDLRATDLAGIRKVYDSFPMDVLLVPRHAMAEPVVATAWGRRYRSGSVDPQRLADFVASMRGRGPSPTLHLTPGCPRL